MTLGEKLRAWRGEMTQTEAAARCGRRQPTYSDWENDVCKPDMESLPKIAAAVGLTIDRLLDDHTAPKRAKRAA